MSLTNVSLWSNTAASNTDVGGNTLAENVMLPSGTNNSFRELMSEVAKLYDDLGGVNTVGGTADVITVTTSSVFTALATGLILAFKASGTNTTNVTLAADGLTAKAVRKFTTAETALVAGDLVSGQRYRLIYDAAANSAAGAWIVLNPSVSMAQANALLGGIQYYVKAATVDLNTLADTAIAITLPTGFTKYRFGGLVIVNLGPGAASLTTAKFGLFSAAGGAGFAVFAAGTVMTAITAQGLDTAAASTLLSAPTAILDYTTLYFRVTTVQGAAAASDIYLQIQPLS